MDRLAELAVYTVHITRIDWKVLSYRVETKIFAKSRKLREREGAIVNLNHTVLRFCWTSASPQYGTVRYVGPSFFSGLRW
jgi:hypothetical protein